MPTGAPLLPVTKVGAGDKERAYVLRQNCFLKLVLGVLCIFMGLSTAIVYTRYEVHVQRRNSIEGAKEHREEEHASHMRVMRLSMLLQRHLEDEVHDVAVLTTYRAWLMRAVGDYQLRVIERANCTEYPIFCDGLRAEGTKFDTELERLLKLLWDDVVKEGKTAQKALHNITHAIVSELRQDDQEQGEYERVMADAGEDPGHFGYHNHEVEYRGGEEHEEHDGHGGHHGHHGNDPYHPYGDDADADDEHHHAGDAGHPHNEGDDDDEEHLAGALEALMSRLMHNDSVVMGVSNATLDEWRQLHESALHALEDEEQEVDMPRIEKKISLALNASHAHVAAYNESEHGSRLDYLGEVIHKARLAPHRDELLDLIHRWQDGELRISEPLNRIEELIDEDVLDPDVLVLRGDYEHYRYD